MDYPTLESLSQQVQRKKLVIGIISIFVTITCVLTVISAFNNSIGTFVNQTAVLYTCYGLVILSLSIVFTAVFFDYRSIQLLTASNIAMLVATNVLLMATASRMQQKRSVPIMVCSSLFILLLMIAFSYWCRKCKRRITKRVFASLLVASIIVITIICFASDFFIGTNDWLRRGLHGLFLLLFLVFLAYDLGNMHECTDVRSCTFVALNIWSDFVQILLNMIRVFGYNVYSIVPTIDV